MNPGTFLRQSTGWALALALGLVAPTVHGEVKLHGLFSDNMVLQRDTRVPVWGWADEG